MQNVTVNVNGEILTGDAALAPQISVFDRAYLYGDSLYEVNRSYDGKLFAVNGHLQRLEKSAALCRMVLGQKLEAYAQEMRRTVDAFYRQFKPGTPKPEAYCRLVLSRGIGRIGFGLECLQTATQFAIIVQPLSEPTEEQFRKGMRLKIVDRLRNDPRALDPAAKTGNYLNSLLAYLEAVCDGEADDALMCNADGHMTEGSTFNVFYVRRGIIATSPLEIGILDGITRRALIDYARKQGLEVREVRFPRERMHEADEVFITSTIKEVFPVTTLDGRKVGDGKPGPITTRLRAGFREYLRENWDS